MNANAETVLMEIAKQRFNPWIAGGLLGSRIGAQPSAAMQSLHAAVQCEYAEGARS